MIAFFSSWSLHVAAIAATFAAIAGVGKVYSLFRTEDQIESDHLAVSKAVAWCAHGSWLDTMQRGARFATRLFTRIYGEARDPDSATLSDFLTARAWQRSALIASWLVLAFPLLLLAFSVGYLSLGTEGVWAGVISALFILVLFVLVTQYFVRLWPLQEAVSLWRAEVIFHGAFEAIEEEAIALARWIAVPIIMAFAIIAFTIKMADASDAVAVFLTIALLPAMLVGLARAVMRSVSSFGAWAPVVILGALMLTPWIVVPLATAAALFQVFLNGRLVPGAFPLAFAVLLWSGIGLLLLWLPTTKWKIGERRISRVWGFVALFATATITIILVIIRDPSIEALGLVGALMWPFFGAAGPVTVLIYSAIFANSLPDWLSVASSRHFLTQASRTRDIGRFFLYLSLDLILVLALMIATAAILWAGYALAYAMVEPLVKWFSIPLEIVPRSFVRGAFTTSYADWRGLLSEDFSKLDSPNAGRLIFALMIIVGMTSILPTAFNALCMLALLFARLLALMLGRPLLWLHAFLVIPQGVHEKDREKKLEVSRIIVGLCIALGVWLPLYAIWWWLSA